MAVMTKDKSTMWIQRLCSNAFFNRDAIGARDILRCLTSNEQAKSLVRVPGTGGAQIGQFDY